MIDTYRASERTTLEMDYLPGNQDPVELKKKEER